MRSGIPLGSAFARGTETNKTAMLHRNALHRCVYLRDAVAKQVEDSANPLGELY